MTSGHSRSPEDMQGFIKWECKKGRPCGQASENTKQMPLTTDLLPLSPASPARQGSRRTEQPPPQVLTLFSAKSFSF